MFRLPYKFSADSGMSDNSSKEEKASEDSETTRFKTSKKRTRLTSASKKRKANSTNSNNPKVPEVSKITQKKSKLSVEKSKTAKNEPSAKENEKKPSSQIAFEGDHTSKESSSSRTTRANKKQSSSDELVVKKRDRFQAVESSAASDSNTRYSGVEPNRIDSRNTKAMKKLANNRLVSSKKQLKAKTEAMRPKIDIDKKRSSSKHRSTELVGEYRLRSRTRCSNSNSSTKNTSNADTVASLCDTQNSAESDNKAVPREKAEFESAETLGAIIFSGRPEAKKKIISRNELMSESSQPPSFFSKRPSTRLKTTGSAASSLNNAAATIAATNAVASTTSSMSTAANATLSNVSSAVINEESTEAQSESQSSDDQINNSLEMPRTDLIASNFAILSQFNTYVDKTAAIEAILKRGSCLVTAPRGFGKSSLLSMIDYFFSLEMNNGIPLSKYYVHDAAKEKRVPITDTANYNLFSEKKFKITENEKAMRIHFGQYPVMKINFKSPAIRTANDAEKACRNVISEAFQQHEYLTKSEALESRERKLCSTWSNKPHLIEDVSRSLQELSMCLRKHFQRKIIVLVDEYDSVCVETMLSLSNDEEIENTMHLFGSILEFLLKGNDENVELGFVTGISYIGTAELAGLNNLNCYRFSMNEPFFEFYGLTESEVNKVLSSFPMEHEIEEVKKECNGYEYNGKKIYNFLSVLSYLQEGILSNYWSKSGVLIGLTGALRCSKIKYNVGHLLQGNAVEIGTLAKWVPKEMVILKKYLENPNINDTDVSRVFGFYLEQGYLAIVRQTRSTLVVKIPNREIKEEFSNLLTKYFVEKWNVDMESMKNCADSLNNIFCDPRRYLCEIRESLDSIFSSVVLTDGHPLNESVFHHILCFIILHTKYKCCTKLYLTDGKRLDLCFECFGVIIEIKFNGTSTVALKQILEKNDCSIFSDSTYTSYVIEKYMLISMNITKRNDDDLSVNLTSYLIDNKNMKHESIL